MRKSRDRFILSKGHTCPIQYSALALTGYVPMEDLKTLRQFGSKFQGHPSMTKCPGIDISTGSLGQGIVKRIGVQDWFGQSGPYEKLLEINGITKKDIVKTAEELLG